jgi:uncharacterized protein (DUF1697 family)
MIWIALLRGINVGGRNSVPMRDLRAIFEEIGGESVSTYIQSGNVVFRGPDEAARTWPSRIADAVSARFGCKPEVRILAHGELARAAANCPFAPDDADATTLHLFVLAKPPVRPDLAAIERSRAASEAAVLDGRFFYLLAPDGIGRSRLARRAEALLGEPATARNWRTVAKLLDIAATLHRCADAASA